MLFPLITRYPNGKLPASSDRVKALQKYFESNPDQFRYTFYEFDRALKNGDRSRDVAIFDWIQAEERLENAAVEYTALTAADRKKALLDLIKKMRSGQPKNSLPIDNNFIRFLFNPQPFSKSDAIEYAHSIFFYKDKKEAAMMELLVKESDGHPQEESNLYLDAASVMPNHLRVCAAVFFVAVAAIWFFSKDPTLVRTLSLGCFLALTGGYAVSLLEVYGRELSMQENRIRRIDEAIRKNSLDT